MVKSMLELQDIFNRYGREFIASTTLTTSQHKAFNSIRRCRTHELGSNSYQCEACGHTEISYNSCRNRNCNKCQTIKRHEWMRERLNDALPVPYFHVVFTVPHVLNQLFLGNLKVLLNSLFSISHSTVSDAAANKDFFGGQIGIVSTLHTWGQNLSFHPHVHMMIPGVGLSPSGLSLVKASKKFFLPVKTLAKIFRARFLTNLKNLYDSKTLVTNLDALSFQKLIDSLFKVDWVVYTKKPFASTWHLIRYLSNYTNKVAISNARLISMENYQVSYRYKDYRDLSSKVMELPVNEFLRRFFLHVLPSGFVRIRHYGLLSNALRNKKLVTIKTLLGFKIPIRLLLKINKEIELIQNSIRKCSFCGGSLISCADMYHRIE